VRVRSRRAGVVRSPETISAVSFRVARSVWRSESLVSELPGRPLCRGRKRRKQPPTSLKPLRAPSPANDATVVGKESRKLC
jgi:hypothetical protein